MRQSSAIYVPQPTAGSHRGIRAVTPIEWGFRLSDMPSRLAAEPVTHPIDPAIARKM
jgi:hypothetical protein